MHLIHCSKNNFHKIFETDIKYNLNKEAHNVTW
jgi:hypothetical protein